MSKYFVLFFFFLFLLKNIDCGYLLELPHWSSSNKYSQSIFWAEIWKISEMLSENFHFLLVKCSVYLNRRVFVMIFFRCVSFRVNMVGLSPLCSVYVIRDEHRLLIVSENQTASSALYSLVGNKSIPDLYK